MGCRPTPTHSQTLLLTLPTGIVRASSIFPILSTILLLLGGLSIGAGRFYSRRNNMVLSAGILFVAAGKLAHWIHWHIWVSCWKGTQGEINACIQPICFPPSPEWQWVQS